MKIIIPPYAQERIKAYNLTEELVKDAIRNPDEIVKGYEGKLIAHKLLNGYVLRGVYLKAEEGVKVTPYIQLKRNVIGGSMKAHYDKEANVLLIKISNNKPEYGEDIGKGVVVHFDKNKNPVEIEILSAKKYLVDWIEQALEIKSEVLA